jgi:hypothetical protein
MLDEWMNTFLCECVLEKNKLLIIFGGNTMLVQYHFKDNCTTYYWSSMGVQSSLWEGKRDSPMICWKGWRLGYYILPPSSSTCAKSSLSALCVPFFLQ